MLVSVKGVVQGVECDVCKLRGDRGSNPLVMRRELKRLGWQQSEERDLCPKCVL